MQKISKISILAMVIALACGIASLCVNSNSQLFIILDTTAVVGFLTLFAFGTVTMAHASKEVQLIPNTPQRVIFKGISNFSGIFCGAASLGLMTLMVIAKIQEVHSVRELSFYGKPSSLLAFTIGTLFFLISKKFSFKSDNIEKQKPIVSEMQAKLIKKYRRLMIGVVLPLIAIVLLTGIGLTGHKIHTCLMITLLSFVFFLIGTGLNGISELNDLNFSSLKDKLNNELKFINKTKLELSSVLLHIEVLKKEGVSTDSLLIKCSNYKQSISIAESREHDLQKELTEMEICEINSFIKYLFGPKLGTKIEKSWIMQ